jgi:hypothetical protein
VIRKLRHLQQRAVIIMHDTHEITARALPIVLDSIDAENARRAETGARPIRILSYVDLAREQLAPGLEDWLRDTGAGIASRAAQVAALAPGSSGAHVTQRR